MTPQERACYTYYLQPVIIRPEDKMLIDNARTIGCVRLGYNFEQGHTTAQLVGILRKRVLIEQKLQSANPLKRLLYRCFYALRAGIYG